MRCVKILQRPAADIVLLGAVSDEAMESLRRQTLSSRNYFLNSIIDPWPK